MPLPDAQALVNIEILNPTIVMGFSTAGIAYAQITFNNLSVPPPNICRTLATFFPLYTATREPYSNPTFFVIKCVASAVLTPGFQAAPTLSLVTPSISMALVSPSVLTEGLFTASPFGIASMINGPPQGIQVPINSLGLATTIAASGNTTSVVIPSYYFPHIVFGVTSTQAGAINIQRYVDVAGTVANGSALTTSLSANTAAVNDTVSSLGFGSFTIQITNTGASSATISSVVLLMLSR